MQRSAILASVAGLAVLFGCTSPAEKAAEAQERMANSQNELIQERLRLAEEHEDCVDSAGEDQTEMARCDQILKRIDALH